MPGVGKCHNVLHLKKWGGVAAQRGDAECVDEWVGWDANCLAVLTHAG